MSEGQKGKSIGRKASQETRLKMIASSKKGEDNQSAKLTIENVLEIRLLNLEGIGQRKIGRKFNVAKSTVASIVNRKTWKHI